MQCAFEEILAEGVELAAEAFAAPGPWRSPRVGVTVRRPDGALLAGLDGTGPAPDWEGALGSRLRGWAYPAPADERGAAPRAAYGIAVEWHGSQAWVSASIAPGDLPGTCPPGGVAAHQLANHPPDPPDPAALRQFVHCAARALGGSLAGPRPILAGDWGSGPIYVFVLDALGATLFTARPGGAPELPVPAPAASRDALRAALAHGEAWLYYDASDPATGRVGNKAAFLRRGTLGRMPVLVGAGYIESHSSFAGP